MGNQGQAPDALDYQRQTNLLPRASSDIVQLYRRSQADLSGTSLDCRHCATVTYCLGPVRAWSPPVRPSGQKAALAIFFQYLQAHRRVLYGLSTGADIWYYLESRKDCGIISIKKCVPDPGPIIVLLYRTEDTECPLQVCLLSRSSVGTHSLSLSRDAAIFVSTRALDSI